MRRDVAVVVIHVEDIMSIVQDVVVVSEVRIAGIVYDDLVSIIFINEIIVDVEENAITYVLMGSEEQAGMVLSKVDVAITV